jgi:hypothetical protein
MTSILTKSALVLSVMTTTALTHGAQIVAAASGCCCPLCCK